MGAAGVLMTMRKHWISVSAATGVVGLSPAQAQQPGTTQPGI